MMTQILKFIHTLFAIFLIWQSALLVERLLIHPPSSFLDMLIDSLFINLFATGIFTLVYSFPIHRLIPKSYYLIHNASVLKQNCERLRLEQFRKLLRLTIWRKNQNKKYYFNGNKSGFDQFEEYTKQGEFGHLMGFVVVFIVNIVLVFKINPIMSLLILLINMLFNFYPIILQRYHRLRLDSIKKTSSL